eukprot:gene42204-51953_t
MRSSSAPRGGALPVLSFGLPPPTVQLPTTDVDTDIRGELGCGCAERPPSVV